MQKINLINVIQKRDKCRYYSSIFKKIKTTLIIYVSLKYVKCQFKNPILVRGNTLLESKTIKEINFEIYDIGK